MTEAPREEPAKPEANGVDHEDMPVALTVKIPGRIYARMKAKAFGDPDYTVYMAGQWLTAAAAERLDLV